MTQKNIVSINSHRGGVGKSLFSVNLTYTLSKNYKKSVLLIDFDILAGNLTHLLNLSADKTINDYIKNEKSIKEAINHNKLGFDVIPAIREEDLLYLEKKAWMNIFRKLLVDIDELMEDKKYDFILIDNHPSLIQPSITALVLSSKSLWILRYNKFNINEFNHLLENKGFYEIIKQKESGIILNLVVENLKKPFHEIIEKLTTKLPIIASIPFDIDLLTGANDSSILFNQKERESFQEAINKTIQSFLFLD